MSSLQQILIKGNQNQRNLIRQETSPLFNRKLQLIDEESLVVRNTSKEDQFVSLKYNKNPKLSFSHYQESNPQKKVNIVKRSSQSNLASDEYSSISKDTHNEMLLLKPR